MARTFITIVLTLISALAGAQELPNASFEDWADSAKTRPTGWTVSPFGAGRSADAVTGSSAMSIWNWYCYGKGTLASAPIPFQHSPTAGGVFFLRGLYKYILGQNGGSGHGADDSAVVNVLFRKYNNATKTSDTVGFATAKLAPSSTFELFNIPVPVTAESDTLEFSFSSSEQGFCTSGDCQCCYLTLDDIDWRILMENVDRLTQPVNDPAIPNPFTNETLLGIAPDGGCRVHITTIDGLTIIDQHYTTGEQMIFSGKELASGTYLYRIITDADTKVGKIIKQ